MGRFIGQPLSRKLIAEIQASIDRYYRGLRRPFVSVSTPPQQLDGGVLKVRVIEFRAGKISVSGADDRTAARLAAQVRFAPGSPIDSADLAEDLEWLNRYPFRSVQPVLTAGSEFGATDLQLVTTSTRPFRAYAGYADSGSPTTTVDRYFAGFAAALPFVPDASLSYQLTGSPDFWVAHGRPFADAGDPRYTSDAIRASLPTAPRQDFELTADYVSTSAPSRGGEGFFTSHVVIYEASLGYRSALSNALPLAGDLFLGFETKRESTETIFVGPVASQALDIEQFVAEYAYAVRRPHGGTSLDIALRLSPGGLGQGNTNKAFAAFELPSARYTPTSATTLSQDVLLPLGLRYDGSVFAQYANRALPRHQEQFGYGGQALIRGYSADDGSYDLGVFSAQRAVVPDRPPAAIERDRGRGFVLPPRGRRIWARHRPPHRRARFLGGGRPRLRLSRRFAATASILPTRSTDRSRREPASCCWRREFSSRSEPPAPPAQCLAKARRSAGRAARRG